MTEKKTGNLEFKYARMRIKRIKKLPPLCRNYDSQRGSGNCEMADSCENATYRIAGQDWAICYGGTKSSEREDKRKSIEKQQNELIGRHGKV